MAYAGVVKQNLLSIFIIAATFFGAGFLHVQTQMPEIKVDKQTSAVNFNKYFLGLVSAGNTRLITDLIWIQTLLESDLEHYKGKDLNSWMFLRFNSIAHLDPKFYQNYLYGGLYLSVVKDDVLGSNVLLEKGIQIFPGDFYLLRNLGLNYFYELDDLEKGLFYMEQIQNHPRAPSFFKSIVLKLRLTLGEDPDVIYHLLKQYISDSRDERIREKLSREAYAAKAERDLKCLNYNGKDCDRVDEYGKPYVFRKGRYHTAGPFTPIKLSSRFRQEKIKQVTTF